MSATQQRIIETFERVLPEMSKEDQSYLLGYGEGMAAAMEKKEAGRDAEHDSPGD